MSVQQTTRITSIWGTFMLVTLIAAGFLQRWLHKHTVAWSGAAIALLGFLIIAASGLIGQSGVFYGGVVLLGLGTGLATTSNLSLMLDMTTPENAGLYVGAWGVANALSRLVGSLMGGVVRDLVAQAASSPVTGYVVVFFIMAGLLLISLLMLRLINVELFHAGEERSRGQVSLAEQAALMGEAQ
jgi:BCD family chlorophyll transporter-like MFS transporter